MITFATYGPAYRPAQHVVIDAIRLVDYIGNLDPGEVIEVRAGSKLATIGVVFADGPACAFQPIVRLAREIELVPGDWVEVRYAGCSTPAPGQWLFYGRKDLEE